jgi:hypothetical protein
MAVLSILSVCWLAGLQRYWGHKSGSLLLAIIQEKICTRTEKKIRVELKMVLGICTELNRGVCFLRGQRNVV